MTPSPNLLLSFSLSIALIFFPGENLLLSQQQINPANDSDGSSILLANLKSFDQAPVTQPLKQRTQNRQPAMELIESQTPKSALTRDEKPMEDSPANAGHEDLDALLWLRTAPEFDALTRQTFAAATGQLGKALVNPQWNALVPAERDPQTATSADLPPCVIVDVDETVLDNSMYQLELIRDDDQYEDVPWNRFVDRKVSTVVEGAAEFIQACRAADVKVFFVTNRVASVEQSTRENLIAQNLMVASDPDRILSKNEQPGWSSDKTSRRRAVAEKYRILLLVGDDLNDFVSAKNLTIDQRQRLYRQHQKNWGRSWFVLPNPNYGGWEQATYQYQYQATIEEKRELKRKTLLEATSGR